MIIYFPQLISKHDHYQGDGSMDKKMNVIIINFHASNFKIKGKERTPSPRTIPRGCGIGGTQDEHLQLL